ncbi:MAG: type II toxin-antitoxin system VapC family toxin [Solirubrobacteraceae bacterium]
MARVALDADVLIAFLDAADAQHDRAVDELRPRLVAGEEILVGASVYAEVMVRPSQQGTQAKVDEFLQAIGARVVDVDRDIARSAARLRARHRSLRLPDALSLATATASRAELLSLDSQLRRIAPRADTTS